MALLRTCGQAKICPSMYWLSEIKKGRIWPLRAFAEKSSTFSSSHDYIVCGAGSAGCILANRLSADPSHKVLLLEAGPPDEGVTYIQMPVGLFKIAADERYNWYYNTVPQKHLNNRELFCPRGKVLGGTSSINAMVFIRGHAYDYNRWENEGAKGWSYADCLPYFKKLESYKPGANVYRGGNGPLHVTKSELSHPLFHAFLEAGKEAGYPITEDANGFQQEGFVALDRNIYQGSRWSSTSAYLKPIKEERKQRLQTETEALITKIIFDDSKAIGVEYRQHKELKRARANKEVILSGGSINSPQLLMLSGVGDGDELKKLGIPVVCHLPGVGQNLQDHMLLKIKQASRRNIFSDLGNEHRCKMLAKRGFGSTNLIETAAFIRTEEGVHHPNVALFFVPFFVGDYTPSPVQQNSFEIAGGSLRSRSRGFIKLKSTDPRDHPIIDFNYMSTEEDWKEMRTFIRLSREIFQQKAFDEFKEEELQPGNHVQTDNELDEYTRQNVETSYHPTSSCKMGDSSDKMAVVDNEARVFGVEGLRVVDASIMPSIVSGNTNAPTMMIAEKAADHILGNKLLPRSQVRVYITPETGQR